MNKSKYQKRAEAIHGSKFIDQQPPTDISPENFWKTKVKNMEDIKTYYKRYHPYLPDVLIEALAIHIEKQVKGEIEPSEQFYKYSETNKKLEQTKWDYKKEIEDEKFKGLMMKCDKDMQRLLDEEQQ